MIFTAPVHLYVIQMAEWHVAGFHGVRIAARKGQLRYELQLDIKVQVFALQAVHPTQLC